MYSMYSLIGYSIRSELKKAEKKLVKKSSWQKVWGDFLGRGLIERDICTPVVVAEHYWGLNPTCYLPECAALIEQIKHSNFEGQITALEAQSNLFTIAIPDGATFNNELIEGVFVSLCKQDDYKKMISRFNEDFNTRLRFEQWNNSADEQLTVTYRDPKGKGSISNTIWLRDLTDVLQSKNIEEYGEKTKRNDNGSILSHEMSHQEQTTQFEVIRFVVGFMVYMSMFQSRIKKVESIKMGRADKGAKKLTIKTFGYQKPTGHIAPHYRNLRHPKYYKGEFKDWKAGTRWIPVNLNAHKVEG